MGSSTTLDANEIRRRGRRRLVGAVAIALLLVVFVPMVLDSEPRPPRQEPALAIPPKDNAPALPAPAGSPAAAVKPPPAAAKPEPAKAPAVAAVEAQRPAKAAASGSAASPPRLEGFAVQVGAFREDSKLHQAREKLSAARIAHYTERLETPSGPLTRLRAGPFPTREAAEGAAAILKRSSLDGQVVPLP